MDATLNRPLSVVGFDSAWTDKPNALGAICVIRSDRNGRVTFLEPQLASFAQAIAVVEEERSQSPLCLVTCH